jgi:hypothetical protein
MTVPCFRTLAGPLRLQILDEGNRVAIGENIPRSVANHGLIGLGGRGHLRVRTPFTGRLVIDPLVILVCHVLPLSQRWFP